ncbi:MAG: C-type lectin domain-containing protein, partial [Myxococcota bacterium]
MLAWLALHGNGFGSGTAEVCNGADDDGDGQVDEGPVWVSVDEDGDGYGADEPGHLVVDCAAAPELSVLGLRPAELYRLIPLSSGAGERGGFLSDGSDCDDGDPEVHPGAEELCDAVDADCDRTMDDGCPGAVGTEDNHAWLVFDPSDLLSPEQAYFTCIGAGWDSVSLGDDQQQEGLFIQVDPYDTPYWIGLVYYQYEWIWVDGTPVDYTNWAVGEPAPYADCTVMGEKGTWNSVSCDSLAGVACELVCSERLWHRDDDGDGFGDPNDPDDECEALEGRVTNGLDCDDRDPDQPAVWYLDRDDDGFGGEPFVDCDPPQGVAIGGDCDDGSAEVHPGVEDPPGDGLD